MNVAVEIPEELLTLLARSPLASLSAEARVSAAVAIHLFVTQQVSFSKAAELANQNQGEFEDLLIALGIPRVEYGVEQYESDLASAKRILNSGSD